LGFRRRRVPVAGRVGRVLKWIGLAVLLAALLGSIAMNAALLAFLVGENVSSEDDAFRFRELTVEGQGDQKVALIPLTGVIGRGYGDAFFGGRGMVPSVVAQLKRAGRDKGVRAVLLEIDSPGGGVGDSDLLYHEVRSLRAKGKPVVCHLQDVAASGAYYVAVAGNRIIAQPTTITGSIGVILHGINVEGLFEKIGVREVTIKKGRMKDILSPTRPITPDEERLLQGIADGVFYRFAGIVAKERGLSREAMTTIADGRLFLAPEALKAGLIDGIGYREDALAAAGALAGVKKPRLIRYEKMFSFRDLLSASSGSVAPAAGFWDGLMEACAPKPMYLWALR
jgi:protease-4